jgi:hypothetical protein
MAWDNFTLTLFAIRKDVVNIIQILMRIALLVGARGDVVG